MKRHQADNKYKWDFSKLYKNSQQWKDDLNLVIDKAQQISKLKNKLNNKKEFLIYLTLDKEIDFIVAKLNQYIHMYDIDQTNSEFQELDALFSNAMSQVAIDLSFVTPEIIKINQEQIEQYLTDSEFESYKFMFKKIFKKSKHILENDAEELLSKIERSRGATAELYDTLSYADKQEHKLMINNVEQLVDTTLFKTILEDSDAIKEQELRKQVWDIYFKNVVDRKYSYAKIYESILLKQTEDFKVRNYTSALEMSLFNDQVTTQIYEKLLSVAKQSIDVLKDYYLLIKDKLGLTKFFTTDRELKLAKEYNKKFSVDEGIAIVKESLSVLGKEYSQNLEIAMQDNMIDYYEDTTKVDGAYSSGGTGVDPIILMNWDDKLSSLNTLAHEIGHSVHTLFSDQNQKYPLNDYPIILAEVASTFNEHILFDYLYSNTTNKDEKIYLLQQRIFDLVSTFYRQIQFADFEYSAHKMVANNEPITSENLMKLFKDKENEYGYDIFDDKDRQVYHWPYISHFFHSPFYVYKYAIDLVASYKLYDDFKKGNNNIINFLKSGCYKEPLEILKDCGVDFNDNNTYTPLIKEIKRLTLELKNAC
ncbi:oligoendopeptidase F [Spiroplasma culicicola]|uniref:Oligopeptidase F n=1 Tax=Spiroplasma culicicola AES-1 TaxID=1276246 RepID=W6A8X2_9MOLU|nr:oligoendopeptidase F [Spiroplasma culicicola]AHI53340.1 oligoendopeptidase F [Spiroplasma culicicola AES-1]